MMIQQFNKYYELIIYYYNMWPRLSLFFLFIPLVGDVAFFGFEGDLPNISEAVRLLQFLEGRPDILVGGGLLLFCIMSSKYTC